MAAPLKWCAVGKISIISMQKVVTYAISSAGVLSARQQMSISRPPSMRSERGDGVWITKKILSRKYRVVPQTELNRKSPSSGLLSQLARPLSEVGPARRSLKGTSYALRPIRK